MEDEKYGNTSIPFVENSYKMIPEATFNSEQARRLAEDILHRNFKGVKYEMGYSISLRSYLLFRLLGQQLFQQLFSKI